MSARLPGPGDWVVLAAVPAWVVGLPEESKKVFDACLGRSYLVTEID